LALLEQPPALFPLPADYVFPGDFLFRRLGWEQGNLQTTCANCIVGPAGTLPGAGVKSLSLQGHSSTLLSHTQRNTERIFQHPPTFLTLRRYFHVQPPK
jgi:hypothetical protein